MASDHAVAQTYDPKVNASSPRPFSPLVPEGKVSIEGQISAEHLIGKWTERYALDVSEELRGVPVISLCTCVESGLKFFWPVVAGSPALYAALQEFPWYYRKAKWEHTHALDLLSRGQSSLDVGCGRGEFVSAATSAGIFARGLDSNTRAIAIGRSEGLDLVADSLYEHGMTHAGHFDAITAFQVLEHVPAPLSFLRECLVPLKPGGLLILGVPDGDGWLTRTLNLLDMPPHHVTRWGKEAFHYLPKVLPVQVVSVEIEPLDSVHVREFASAKISPVSISTMFEQGRPLWKRALGRLVAETITATGWHRRLRGISMLAVMRKVE